jgi:hypothetical protein
MLVSACYYKASYEKRKWPWQEGYVSYKIAQQARGGHSHEELMFTPRPIGTGAICFSSSSRDGGCRFEKADVILRNPDKWDILPVTDDDSKANAMYGFCLKQNGKPYDYSGVFSFKLSMLDENPDRWYCSEVCDTAKRIVGLWPYFYRSHPSDSYWIQQFLSRLGDQK